MTEQNNPNPNETAEVAEVVENIQPEETPEIIEIPEATETPVPANTEDELTEDSPEDEIPAAETPAEIAPESSSPKKKNPAVKIALICLAALILVIGGVCVLMPDFVDYVFAGMSFNSGNYEKALVKYEEIPDYKDSAEKILLCHEGIGDKQMEEKNFGDAVISYKKAENTEKLDKAYLAWGDFYVENKSYYNAIDAYENITTMDMTEKLSEAYYLYFVANQNDYGVLHLPKNYIFFTALALDEYKDSKQLYEEAYSWKVEVRLQDAEDASFYSDLDQVKRTKKMYFVVSAKGGHPGEVLKLKCKASIPGGTQTYNLELAHDYYAKPILWYNSPSSAPTGNATFKVYNKETNDLLFTKKFKVTK
ncbi:MAG: hypothetical protein IKM61_02605 [Eubacteriaceae bacterium]|nr:hypothetical protein [Eubacteriaceae bacterium]